MDGTDIFPRALRVEDQQYARTIYAICNASQGFSAGGLAGFGIGGAQTFLRRRTAGFQRSLTSAGSRGAMIGAGLFLALSAYRIYRSDKMEFKVWSWKFLDDDERLGARLWGTSGAGLSALMVAGQSFKPRILLSSVVVGSLAGFTAFKCFGDTSTEDITERNENVEYLLQRGRR